MPQTTEAARFLRAALKSALRLQRVEGTQQTVSSLQRIKVSVQKTRKRRK